MMLIAHSKYKQYNSLVSKEARIEIWNWSIIFFWYLKVNDSLARIFLSRRNCKCLVPLYPAYTDIFYKFIYFWLRWVFVAARGLSLVALLCVGFSLRWLLCCGARALGSRASVVVARGLYSAGSVVVAHGLSCSAACGIFPDQGSNPCPLHWQADS